MTGRVDRDGVVGTQKVNHTLCLKPKHFCAGAFAFCVARPNWYATFHINGRSGAYKRQAAVQNAGRDGSKHPSATPNLWCDNQKISCVSSLLADSAEAEFMCLVQTPPRGAESQATSDTCVGRRVSASPLHFFLVAVRRSFLHSISDVYLVERKHAHVSLLVINGRLAGVVVESISVVNLPTQLRSVQLQLQHTFLLIDYTAEIIARRRKRCLHPSFSERPRSHDADLATSAIYTFCNICILR
jgi:hypothetical protein